MAQVWILSEAYCVYIHAHFDRRNILLFVLAENIADIFLFIFLVDAQDHQIQKFRNKSTNSCLHFVFIGIKAYIYDCFDGLNAVKQVLDC